MARMPRMINTTVSVRFTVLYLSGFGYERPAEIYTPARLSTALRTAASLASSSLRNAVEVSALCGSRSAMS